MHERQKLEKLGAIVSDLEKRKQKTFSKYRYLIMQTNKACEKADKTHDPNDWKKFNENRRKRNLTKNDYEILEAKLKKYNKRYERKKTRCEMAVKAANEALEQFCSWYGGRLTIENTKIVFRDNDKTDVYYGGEYKAGDGEGHGHVVVNSEGIVVYLRDTWQKHGRALIDDAKKGRDGANRSK